MKKQFLCSILMLVAAVAPVRAQKSTESAAADTESKSVSALKNAVGAFSAQGLLLTFMAVNSLGDAYAKKAYSKEQATTILTTYEKTTDNIVGVLKSLPGKAGSQLSEGDVEYLKQAGQAYVAIRGQIEALKAFIDSGDEAEAAKFEKNRKQAKAQIDKLFSE